MTITMECRKADNNRIEVTLEWRKPDIFQAFVYENYGNWIVTHKSLVAKDEKTARAAFNRFCRKYL